MSVTHATYAKKIFEHVNLVYGVELKKYNLIYGSIKPDVSVFFSKYPHYINESLDKLCDNVNILIDSADTKEEIETRAFSRELGVILHYITDYFCKVHNDINGKLHPTNYTHVIYEQSFQNKLKLYELDTIREDVLNSLNNDIRKIENTSLKKYILYKHNKYMKEAGKIYLYNPILKTRMVDMNYSFGMSMIVASYIVESVLENSKL